MRSTASSGSAAGPGECCSQLLPSVLRVVGRHRGSDRLGRYGFLSSASAVAAKPRTTQQCKMCSRCSQSQCRACRSSRSRSAEDEFEKAQRRPDTRIGSPPPRVARADRMHAQGISRDNGGRCHCRSPPARGRPRSRRQIRHHDGCGSLTLTAANDAHERATSSVRPSHAIQRGGLDKTVKRQSRSGL